MTQALAGFNEHGIVLATDSRATRFNHKGAPKFFQVEKLLPLGSTVAILSGGAGVSVPLALALRQEITRRRGLDGLEEIVEFALSFLSRGYARFLCQHGPEPEGFRRIYFVLAGFSPTLPSPGYSLFLLGSEDDELPLRLVPTGNALVMPRNLGLEMKLIRALATGAPLAEILKMSKNFLEKLASCKEEVGPPFHFATITGAGYEKVEV